MSNEAHIIQSNPFLCLGRSYLVISRLVRVGKATASAKSSCHSKLLRSNTPEQELAYVLVWVCAKGPRVSAHEKSVYR